MKLLANFSATAVSSDGKFRAERLRTMKDSHEDTKTRRDAEGCKRIVHSPQSFVASRLRVNQPPTMENPPRLNNPGFNPVEFDGIRIQTGLNSFVLTPKQWIDDGELTREATTEESSVVQTEGGREVHASVPLPALPVR